MANLFQDLRYGARMLLKKPGFAFVAVLTLALGIGANTSIFSVINAVLLRPLPYPNEDRLVVMQGMKPGEQNNALPENTISYLNFKDYQQQARSFESMAIAQTTEATLTGEGEPARLRIAIASSDIFKVLGIAPMIGRGFRAEEDIAGSSQGLNSVILSHDCWRVRFGSDREIIGRTIALDSQPYQITGVMPGGVFPLETEPVEFWITTAYGGDAGKRGTMNGSRGYPAYAAMIGRLGANVSAAQAQAEMDSIAEGLAQKYPASNAQQSIRVTPLRELFAGRARQLLLLLSGIVVAVLLIACSNVANLLLARATVRHREIAIRAALGASRMRIAQQLLAESLMLGVAGGLAGLLVSLWGVDLLVRLLPADVPRITGLAPDWRVFLFTISAAILTGILCGLAPALSLSRTNLAEAMKEGGRSATSGASQRLFRNSLVTVQLAVALVLLIGAGLLLRSFIRLQQVDAGLDSQNVLTAKLVLSSDRYDTPQQRLAFYDSLLERVRQLPAVTAVSMAQSIPFTGNDNGTKVTIIGRPLPEGEEPEARLRFIGLDYFRTVGIAQITGRDFNNRDRLQSSPVVIINQAFADEMFKGENPLGQKLSLGWGGDEPKEIVGIYGNVRHRGPDDLARPEMYVPLAQFPPSDMSLLARVKTNPESLIVAITTQAHELDSEIPLTAIKTLDQYRADTVALPRFFASLLTLFAGLAMTLTAIGLYGVISYSVTQRTAEIGIRMALGARPFDILKMVVGQGLKLSALGIAIGLMGAFYLSKLVRSLLFEVGVTDPVTFVIVPLMLAVVAALASYIPARRATKVDPTVALRHE